MPHPHIYKQKNALIAGGLMLGIIGLLLVGWSRMQPVANGQTACPQISVPALTHGFTPNVNLPFGDHFLLPQAFSLTVPNSAALPGFSSFPVNATTFGDNVTGIGGYPGTSLTGASYTMPGGQVTMLSCLDSVWDSGFVLASAGATVGDTTTLFVQKPDGSGVQTLAVFTYETGGARITTLHPNVLLFRENRLGNAGRLMPGEWIPFDLPGGGAGKRTSLLILAFEMKADSPLNDCFQFGATMARAQGIGASSLVFTDFLVKRMEQAGDRNRPGAGMINGLSGGYPTGLICPVICPECPPPPTLCPQLAFPAITHGFTTSSDLPKGDHFLLPQPFTLSAPALAPVPGYGTFPVNPANFGGTVTEVGGFPGTSLNGISYSAPSGSLTLLSCLDSLWDSSFMLASAGATVGDKTTFFVQKPDGSGVQTLLVITNEDGGARLTALHPNVFLFRNDRLGNRGRLQVGDWIGFDKAAGVAGNRSDLLVMAFEVRPDSPLNDCFQFGTTLQRASGVGTNSLVFTDFVLKRMEQPGDRNLAGAGLLGGLTGGYPTGVVCPLVCPACPTPPTPCPQIANPAITHGFATAERLPQGDHFLLPQPFMLNVPMLSPMSGFSSFPINEATFGGTVVGIGGYPNTTLTGFSYATPSGSVTALSCLDSIWDSGFVLAGAGATLGDTISLFVQKPDGLGVQALAVFTHEDGGVRLTTLHQNVLLFNGDRYGDRGRLQVGEFIPFGSAAGAAGRRTGLLVMAFEMRPDSPLNDCFQFGATIQRAAGSGVSSLVFTDFVVKRMELPNDRTRPGAGMLGGLLGGYPTGLICPVICPTCPPPPAIACQPDQSVCVEQAGATSAVVNYPMPGEPGSTCTPPAGSSFPLGVTTVTCTATSGGHTATCSFNVEVKPRVAITCPSNISVPFNGGGGAGTPVTYATPTASLAGVPVTCLPVSGTAFPVGTTTVNCTASSECNTATCSFTVTVQPQPPTISCPVNQSVCVSQPGATSAVVNYAIPVAAPTGASVNCSPASGASFPVGVTTVTCNATSSGMTDTCSFTIEVKPRVEITCPSNISVPFNGGGGAGTPVTYATPTASLAGVPVTCLPVSGTAFPVGTTTVNCTASSECNTATCSFTVTVQPQPPTISCPVNQSVCVSQPGATSAVVNYAIPAAAPTGASVNCSPASGASFPVGVTTVTCNATSSGMTDTCSFTVEVKPRAAIVCPANISVSASGPGGIGANVSFPVPATNPAGAPVTCTPASGTPFPIGTTTVTCTASSECGTSTCSFTVTVAPIKCDTFCWRSPQWWLLNLHRVPRGEVLISGVNQNIPVSTGNTDALVLALQGNVTGNNLTAQQRFNQEYVAAQLNLLLAGGGGSPTSYNVMWTNLSCYGILFAPVPLSNGVILTRDSMIKDLYMQAQLATIQNRTADFSALAGLLDLFNGNDLFGCN